MWKYKWKLVPSTEFEKPVHLSRELSMSRGQLGLTFFILDTPRAVLRQRCWQQCRCWAVRTGMGAWAQMGEEQTGSCSRGPYQRHCLSRKQRKGSQKHMKGLFLQHTCPSATQLPLHSSCPSTYSTSIAVHPAGCLLTSSTSEGQILLLQR